MRKKPHASIFFSLNGLSERGNILDLLAILHFVERKRFVWGFFADKISNVAEDVSEDEESLVQRLGITTRSLDPRTLDLLIGSGNKPSYLALQKWKCGKLIILI